MSFSQDNNINYHFNNFNLLRLLAALQVVYMHTVEHLDISNELVLYINRFVSHFPGVSIFFLISGYLITMSYEKNSDLKEYTKNRALRIFPGLYVSFLVGLFILWYFDQFIEVNLTSVFMWIAAQLTLFQFYNPEFIRDFGVGVINGSLWTISVELSFYIILPFLYIFLKKDFYRRFGILMMASILFYFYINKISTETFIYEKLISVSILPYLFYFLIGLFLYKYREQFRVYIENKILIYALLYLLVVYFDTNNFFYLVFKQLIFSLFIFSAVFSCRSLSYQLMGNNDFTYGIYIYHMLIVNILVELGLKEEIHYLFIVLVISFLSGVFSYFLVEKPFLNMKKRSLYHETIE